MHSIVRLEEHIATRPNSIEVNQALADAYAGQGRWEEAAKTYQTLVALYPATASLFVNRIRLGAMALAVSSTLVLAAELIQPAMFNARVSPSSFVRSVSSTEYLTAQILFLLAFPLFSTAAISIYKLLSYTHDHRPAFWAMVFSVIGAGLSMPALGVNAAILPLIARLYLARELETLNIYFAMQAMPWSLVLHLGGYIFVLGIVIFSWVIWRNKNFPKWEAVLFLTGWLAFILSTNQTSRIGSILIGTFIFIGGIGLARSAWTQAPLQFEPAAYSS